MSLNISKLTDDTTKTLIKGAKNLSAAIPKAYNKSSTGIESSLEGLSTIGMSLVKKTKDGITDLSTSADKIKIYISKKDNSNNIRKIPYLFDSDNSFSLSLQGHKSDLSIASGYRENLNEYPIQEAFYQLAPFLRDLQFNGKFSDRTKEMLLDLGTSEEKMLSKINDNLKRQKIFTSTLKPSDSDCLLYRYIDLDLDSPLNKKFKQMLDKLNIGDRKILDWSPIHTAGDIKFIEQMSEFHSETPLDVLRIDTQKGSRLVHGTPVANNTKEIIFPSKSEFIFNGKKQLDGLNLWDFTYVLPD